MLPPIGKIQTTIPEGVWEREQDGWRVQNEKNH